MLPVEAVEEQTAASEGEGVSAREQEHRRVPVDRLMLVVVIVSVLGPCWWLKLPNEAEANVLKVRRVLEPLVDRVRRMMELEATVESMVLPPGDVDHGEETAGFWNDETGNDGPVIDEKEIDDHMRRVRNLADAGNVEKVADTHL